VLVLDKPPRRRRRNFNVDRLLVLKHPRPRRNRRNFNVDRLLVRKHPPRRSRRRFNVFLITPLPGTGATGFGTGGGDPPLL